MNSLIYESSGKSINLNNNEIKLLKGHDFYSHKRDVESNLKSDSIGEYLKRFTLRSRNFKFSLIIEGENYKDIMLDLRRTFEEDVEKKKPGKLVLNGSYVECFLVESTSSNPKKYSQAEILNLTVLALTPLWITEKEFNFSIHSEKTDIEGFKLPMRFPMHFVANSKQAIVENELSANTLSRIEFYGPVTDPTILIDDYPYSIKGTLLDNERYVIDQRDKTVVKITEEGDIVNSFHLRQKSPSVFEPIPKGDHIVNYDGTFSVRIVLFEGSVTPNWI